MNTTIYIHIYIYGKVTIFFNKLRNQLNKNSTCKTPASSSDEESLYNIGLNFSYHLVSHCSHRKEKNSRNETR